MAGKVLEIQNLIGREQLASDIARYWDSWNMQRKGWLAEKRELRDYIFATDTTTTTNRTLPWKNSTTIPKLCQIRDNLHSNYLSSITSNENWVHWEAGNFEASTMTVKKAVTNYIKSKIHERNLRDKISQLLYDYIDYGNAFAEVVWVYETRQNELGGEDVVYVGPDIIRISPLDLVFNPVAPDFASSPKIRRYIKSIGELELDREKYTDQPGFGAALDKLKSVRNEIGSYKVTDVDRAAAFSIDGFGSMYEYYSSGYVEILEFEGDIHDTLNGKMLTRKRITVVDRSYVAMEEDIPSWFGKSYKLHCGWRSRPDNLYAMGPLDNLVGMQYRVDHLENAKADAMDLAIHPPLGVAGNVEEFSWGPGEVIDMGDDGQIVELGKSLQAVIAAQNDIESMLFKMEEMAGAPKQAMGIRTPGEKTAFEVQALENAAGRIFQEKVNNFEINLLEPALNMMLELSRRKMDSADVVRVIDDELGVEEFMTITRDDITAKGKLRAMGSRHFAARAQLIQNVTSIFNTAVGQKVEPHTSALALSHLLEDVMGLERWQLFQENIGVEEQLRTQQLVQEMQTQQEVEATTEV
jgi:hypothetical protein